MWSILLIRLSSELYIWLIRYFHFQHHFSLIFLHFFYLFFFFSSSFISWIDFCISFRCLCFLGHIYLFFVLSECVYNHLFELFALLMEMACFGGEICCLISLFYFCFFVGTCTYGVRLLVNCLNSCLFVYKSHLFFSVQVGTAFCPQ